MQTDICTDFAHQFISCALSVGWTGPYAVCLPAACVHALRIRMCIATVTHTTHHITAHHMPPLAHVCHHTMYNLQMSADFVVLYNVYIAWCVMDGRKSGLPTQIVNMKALD